MGHANLAPQLQLDFSCLFLLRYPIMISTKQLFAIRLVDMRNVETTYQTCKKKAMSSSCVNFKIEIRFRLFTI